jgi:dTDP-glucose 4,6-dehydratase
LSRVLITGVAGFIGSHLADALLNNGHKVYGIDNLCTGNLSNIKHLESNKNFKLEMADVSLGIPNNFKIPYDQIFHFASPASPPKYLKFPLETMEVNTLATKFLLDHVKKTGGRLLFASTSEIYGDPLEHPQTEDYWGNVNSIGPRSVYDEAKRFGETLLALYQRENWANSVIIRIFNTYGPRLDPNDGRVVSSFLRDALMNKPLQIYGDGHQTRSFCFVSDLVSGILAAMESPCSGPINLGNPNEFTVLELANLVEQVTEKKVHLEFKSLPQDDPKKRKPDINLAIEKLNWRPKVQLKEGLEITSQWMKSELGN